MKKTSKTVVFFGNERLATGVKTDAPVLRGLIKAGYKVAAVVSSYERGTSRTARDLEVEHITKEHDIPLLLPDRPKDILDNLASYKADIGVLVAYGRIVPESVISLFPHGIINIHPSLLPRHRGPTPIESVILAGDKKTGVSIMSLAKEMDAGPVYGQSEVELTGTESKQELADRLLEIGKAMLLELLPGVFSGEVVSIPQDGSRATYDGLISKEDGIIDWTKPAELIEREIRAFMEWPKSRTMIAGKDIVITQASVIQKTGRTGVIEASDRRLFAYCGKDTLVIEKLKPAGKNEMTAQAFLAGYGKLI